MRDDVEFVEPHRTPSGRRTSGCRLSAPMVELNVATANDSLGRTYACTLTAEEYRRLHGGDGAGA